MTDEDALLAGELALGLLDGDERARALRLVIGDPAFARKVEWWRSRLGSMIGEWPDAAPGTDVETRVMRAVRAPANDDRKWRWIAALTSLAAAAMLVMVVARPAPTPVAPTTAPRAPLLVAVLKPTDADPFGAVYDATRHEVRLSGPVAVPTGRDLELWSIGRDGVPHAAGLVPRGGSGRLRPDRSVTIDRGTTLAVSVEPIGGSPKPTPTGPVIASGQMVAI